MAGDAHKPWAEAGEFEPLRRDLLRFARLQLRNEALAEDLVADTLLALVEKPQAHAGRSSLRTYATGILKHKIVDHLRRSWREVALADDNGDSAGDPAGAALQAACFDEPGHWVRSPHERASHWSEPHAHVERLQFFEVLQACVDALPERSARLFMMREWLELELPEICHALSLSTNHCSVLLFRARLQLRECLQLRWVGP